MIKLNSANVFAPMPRAGICWQTIIVLFNGQLLSLAVSSSFLSFDCPPAPLNIPEVDDLVLGKDVASDVG